MIIEPKIVRNVCLTAHPAGCVQGVKEQIQWVSRQPAGERTPQRVLVIGGSTGYGLAARITAAFWGKADTVSISFEREPSGRKTGTPGWYNNRAFDREARKVGLKAITIEGDAFSHKIKARTIETIQRELGQVDLVIYSLASPMRVDPDTGETYMSVLKPLGTPYTGQTVDMMTDRVSSVTVEPAEEGQTEATVKVMGGEDWKLWIEKLMEADVLDEGAATVAFSYIGPEMTFPLYREGTIGRAKEHLETTASELNKELGPLKGHAYVSVNKALVTRASAVIPVVPLYISILYRVMKDRGMHEGCIEQAYRLFHDRLYAGGAVPVDRQGRIRIDDYEMLPDIQEEVHRRWERVTSESLPEIADMGGFRKEYLQLHGFEYAGIAYHKDVDPEIIPE